MRDTPKLAEIQFVEHGKKHNFQVFGGLHYRKGNRKPYFTITGDLYQGRTWIAGGCLHEEIERHFPGRFTDLIALHLSDIDGVPMYAAGNGLYWLAALDPSGNGFGEHYHGGNREFGNTSRAACLKIALEHFRCTESDILPVLDKLAGLWFTGQREARQKVCADFADTFRDKWKMEAEACIAKHDLVVFGDKRELVA